MTDLHDHSVVTILWLLFAVVKQNVKVLAPLVSDRVDGTKLKHFETFDLELPKQNKNSKPCENGVHMVRVQ